MIGWLTGRRRRDPRAAVAEPRADRPRVLLVENDAHDRDRILPVLDALGVAADVAVDAEDGLRQEGRCEYAGAIIDLNLSAASRCEGFGLIARLRERGRRYPIVIMSHNHGVEYEIRGFEAGADDYMVKWPNRDEMRTRLRTLLAGSATSQEKETHMTNSSREFERARRCIPGGVNSPVRAFRAVGGTPVFFERAEGALLFDIDSRRYVDYVGTWGPAVVGHAHPRVVEAVREAAARGLSFGAPTVLESEMAERVCGLVPSMDKVRMVSSGTEAGLSAIRLARGFTGRDAIVKFEGCYHGHADSLLVKAGSGALTFGVPTSPGVPAGLAEHTLTLSFNDAAGVREAFARFGDRLAAAIVEPIAGNMNCVPPVPGFLETLRGCCDEHGAVLIFDEVMTGFRVAPGGAQSLYGVRPDLTILGKVIGGGMPVGAFGGRNEIMDRIAPDGPVYQAGTLSGNPIAMTAGLTTLELIAEDGFHDRLSATTARLVDGLRERAAGSGIDMATNHVCGMFGLFFTEADEVNGFADVMACDTARFARFFHAMLDEGVYLAPSAFETGFVSSAHADEHLEATFRAAEKAFEALATQS